MPFPQEAKNHLAITLSLANIFTDENGEYPSLSKLLESLNQVERYIRWQSFHPYEVAYPGNSLIKKNITGYLSFDSSIDLFIRHTKIATIPTQVNFTALPHPAIQKLFYRYFLDVILRASFYLITPPTAKKIKNELLSHAKEIISDYNDIALSVDAELTTLARLYSPILTALHEQFSTFRSGHLSFIQHYYETASFLARTEEWLKAVPLERDKPASVGNTVELFCECLTQLERNYLNHNLLKLNFLLSQLRTTTLSLAQYEEITDRLIPLKPKYDFYHTGQDSLSADELKKSYRDAWPKPKLPNLAELTDKSEAKKVWKAMREKHRAEEKEALEQESLRHKKLMPLPLNRSVS